MNKSHPIPNIIVVGILRVLLSTCPNTKKNKTGGVQIHREWASSLKLYLLHKDWFDERGFKSDIFQHTSVEDEQRRITLKKEVKAAKSAIVDGEDATKDDEKQPDAEKSEGGEEEGAEEGLLDEDYFDLEEYKYENDRHRIITAMIISDLFIYMLKHFKANCINQFVYLSQLLVDANGVLVLLKFLNQGFEKFQFEKSQQLDQKAAFLQVNMGHDLTTTIEETVCQLLRLTYKLCRNQKDRIKHFLIQYKGCLIMKKLINKFERDDLCKNAAKVIKIQVRNISKTWRKDNMKVISSVYQYVKLKKLDDWLGWKKEKESGITTGDREQTIEEEKQWFNQDQIRQMNADFNYENYQIFYEDKEDDEDGDGSHDGARDEKSERGQGESQSATERSGAGSNKDGDGDQKKKDKKKKGQDPMNQGQGLHEIVSESNLLYQMESKIQLDPALMHNYEQWLEDEVWSYFD